MVDGESGEGVRRRVVGAEDGEGPSCRRLWWLAVGGAGHREQQAARARRGSYRVPAIIIHHQRGTVERPSVLWWAQTDMNTDTSPSLLLVALPRLPYLATFPPPQASPVTIARDPLHLLVTAYVDAVWTAWQAAPPASSGGAGAGPPPRRAEYGGTHRGRAAAEADVLAPFGVTVAAALHLPCVTYAPAVGGGGMVAPTPPPLPA